MQFQCNFIIPKWFQSLLLMIQNEDADIGFQNYIATYNRNLYIAFLAPFTTETVGMMAPMPSKEPKWKSYINTFQPCN